MAARYRTRGRPREAPRWGRIFRALMVLVLIGAASLVGYALVSDLPAPTRPVVEELPLVQGGT